MNTTSTVPHPLRAMIAKELRENIRWAALLLGSLAVVLGCIAWVFSGAIEELANHTYILMLGPIIEAQMFIFPVLGLGLGLAQLLPEHGRDRFAFLLHRPATATTLFLGKAFTGIILYAVIAGIPYLLLCIYAFFHSTGELYFTWRFFLPGLADLLTGLTYYFAGLLVSFRTAPWIGSRTVPVFAAIGTSAIALSVGTASLSIGGIALALVILSVAAWGAFLQRASELPPAFPQRVALSITLVAGLTIFFVALGFLGYQEITSYRNHHVFTIFDAIFLQIQNESGRTGYIPFLNGSFIQEKFDRHTGDVHYFQLDGTPATAPTEDQRSHSGPYLLIEPESLPRPESAPSYRDFSSLIQPYELGPDNSNKIINHLLYAPHAGLFYYYDLNGNLLGTLGQNGFAASAAGQLPFPSDVRWDGGYLISRHAVFTVSLKNRSAKVLFITPPDEPVAKVEVYGSASDEEGLLLLTPSRLIIFDHAETHILGQIPVRHDLHAQLIDVFLIASLNGHARFTIWYRPIDELGALQTGGTALTYSSDGTLLGTRELPVFHTKTVRLWAPFADGLAGFLNSFAFPFFTPLFVTHPESSAYEIIPLYRSPIYHWATLLPTPLAALILFLLTCRYALSRSTSLVWPLLTLLVGPIGFFVFLAIHPLPRRIRCPACGKRRSITRDLCEHCAAPFPVSRPNGTEIFADAPKIQELVPA